MNKLVEEFRNQPWTNKHFYASWLAQSYYYTSYSTRMLASAAGWSSPLNDRAFYRRSLTHINEEQGHELIALNDLKVLGLSTDDFPEAGITRALWEPQFYKILKDPASLLGYILALETLAVRTFKEFHGELLRTYSSDAVNFVKVHADDDPDHVEAALSQIEKCNEAEKKNIEKNFNQTIQVYGLMLKEIQLVTLEARK
ncbi:MAG: iron-containing redox enzyme family protein [Bdellovibrio sp.]|nr:iron-containing redox enzyme family protein [Bdellovibrio sp.]